MTNLLPICCGFFAKKDFKEEEKYDLCNRRKESEPDSVADRKSTGNIGSSCRNGRTTVRFTADRLHCFKR